MYHTCPVDFHQQLEYITSELHLEPVHLDDEAVRSYLLSPAVVPYPKGKIALTFDDAYQDIYERAMAELLSFNCKATLCIATSGIGDHERETPTWTEGKGSLMVWPELHELRELTTSTGDDLLDFVPHSVSHAYFDRLSAEQIRREVLDSRTTLEEQLGIVAGHILFFCFPGGIGEGTADIQKVLCEAGYIGALRAHAKREHGWSRYSIPRCEPRNIDHLKELIGSINGLECN